jgi:hypothetical protein
MANRAQINGWAGNPALVRGARAERFHHLHEEIEIEMAPTNIFEKIEARDVSHKIAEEELLKHMQTAIVESARVESLATLLEPTFGQNIEKAHKTAQDYFSGRDESKSVAQKLVNSLGISVEIIDANALHLRMASIHALDAMIDRREGGRNRIIKRHLKKKRAASSKNSVPTANEKGAKVSRERIHRRPRD